MNSLRYAASFLVWLVAATLVAAQALPGPPAAEPAKMYEDVEILRQILNRTLSLPRYTQETVSVPQMNWQPNLFGNSLGNTPAFGMNGLGNAVTFHATPTVYSSLE